MAGGARDAPPLSRARLRGQVLVRSLPRRVRHRRRARGSTTAVYLARRVVVLRLRRTRGHQRALPVPHRASRCGARADTDAGRAPGRRRRARDGSSTTASRSVRERLPLLTRAKFTLRPSTRPPPDFNEQGGGDESSGATRAAAAARAEAASASACRGACRGGATEGGGGEGAARRGRVAQDIAYI